MAMIDGKPGMLLSHVILLALNADRTLFLHLQSWAQVFHYTRISSTVAVRDPHLMPFIFTLLLIQHMINHFGWPSTLSSNSSKGNYPEGNGIAPLPFTLPCGGLIVTLVVASS